MTLEQLARDIIARPAHYGQYSTFPAWQWESEAQAYIDNLESGCDYPDDLIEMLARDEAADNVPHTFNTRDEAGYSWGDGPFSAEEWWEDELPGYIAAVRGTFGMGAKA